MSSAASACGHPRPAWLAPAVTACLGGRPCARTWPAHLPHPVTGMLNGFSAALNGFTAVMGDVVLVRRQLDTLRSAAVFRKLKKYITPLLAAGAAVCRD